MSLVEAEQGKMMLANAGSFGGLAGGPPSLSRPRLRGMFGNRSALAGLVATPEQQAESERLTALLGTGGMVAADQRGPFGTMGGRNGGSGPTFPIPRGMFASPAASPADMQDRPDAAGAASWRPTGLRHIAGIVGDALSGMAGGPARYADLLEQRRREAVQAGMAEQQFNRQSKLAELARDAEARAPRYFSSNGDQLRYNPVTGQTETIWDAPSPFDEYAASLGLEPGTEAYATALQDYVLRDSGPTATANDLQLEGARQTNRIGLEGVRQGNRLQLRGTPTYRQANPAPRASRGRGSPRPRSSAPTAVNPQTGQRLTLRNGQWVPAN